MAGPYDLGSVMQGQERVTTLPLVGSASSLAASGTRRTGFSLHKTDVLLGRKLRQEICLQLLTSCPANGLEGLSPEERWMSEHCSAICQGLEHQFLSFRFDFITPGKLIKALTPDEAGSGLCSWHRTSLGCEHHRRGLTHWSHRTSHLWLLWCIWWYLSKLSFAEGFAASKQHGNPPGVAAASGLLAAPGDHLQCGRSRCRHLDDGGWWVSDWCLFCWHDLCCICSDAGCMVLLVDAEADMCTSRRILCQCPMLWHSWHFVPLFVLVLTLAKGDQAACDALKGAWSRAAESGLRFYASGSSTGAALTEPVESRAESARNDLQTAAVLAAELDATEACGPNASLAQRLFWLLLQSREDGRKRIAEPTALLRFGNRRAAAWSFLARRSFRLKLSQPLLVQLEVMGAALSFCGNFTTALVLVGSDVLVFLVQKTSHCLVDVVDCICGSGKNTVRKKIPWHEQRYANLPIYSNDKPEGSDLGDLDEETMQKATAWNMPLAPAVAKDWSTYTNLPMQVLSTFYWWVPDPTFINLKPMEIAFPPFDRQAFAAGDKRSSPSALTVDKYTSKDFLLKHPGVLCGSGEHSMMLLAGILLLTCGVISFLAMCSWAVCKLPRWSTSNFDAVKSVAFLFARFRMDRWWFGVPLLLRGPLLSLCVVAATDFPPAQTTGGIFIIAAFLLLQVMAWPWKLPLLNILDTWVSVILLMLISITPKAESSAAEDLEVFHEVISIVLLAGIVVGLGSMASILGCVLANQFLCQKGIVTYRILDLISVNPQEVAKRLTKTAQQLLECQKTEERLQQLNPMDLGRIDAAIALLVTDVIGSDWYGSRRVNLSGFHEESQMSSADVQNDKTPSTAEEDAVVMATVALVKRAKEVLASEFGTLTGTDKSPLAEDFQFVAPIVGPLSKKEFTQAFGSFKLREAVPDLADNSWFQVDPLEPNRVWFFSRATGTHTGPLGPVPPTGKKIELPPQAQSMLFNESLRKGECYTLTVGYCMDKRIGNSEGVGGVFGIVKAVGKALPFPEGQRLYTPSLRYEAFERAAKAAEA
eukprot:g3488.t1